MKKEFSTFTHFTGVCMCGLLWVFPKNWDLIAWRQRVVAAGKKGSTVWQSTLFHYEHLRTNIELFGTAHSTVAEAYKVSEFARRLAVME